MDDTTDYGGWLEALAERAKERGEDRVNNICAKAIRRAANRLIETEGKLNGAVEALRECQRLADSSKEDFEGTQYKWLDNIYKVASEALK